VTEATSPTDPGEGAGTAGEPPEWWDDPSLPWKHKPARADIACLSWLGAISVYSIVMSVARPTLLVLAPHVLASLGSWSGLVLVGAKAALGDPWWPLVWLLGGLGLAKFDWVYWWAGRLWGRSLIDAWSARSDRSRRTNAWVERVARKYATLAILLTRLPIPLPFPVVFVVLGEAGVSLRRLLVVDIIGSLVAAAAFLAAGFWIGEPAVALMDAYGRYLLWVSLAILVVVVVGAVRQGRKPSARPNGD
jgi:membrane protein DedA with SNARE-associated domain